MAKDSIIVCGFPCMGKSTACQHVNDIVLADLDSGDFKAELAEEKKQDWVAYYVLRAHALCAKHKGSIIMISSHAEVRDELESTETTRMVPCYYVFPTLNSKDSLITAAQIRCDEHPGDEAKVRAKKFLEDNFESAVMEIYSRMRDDAIRCQDPKRSLEKFDITYIPVDMTRGYYMSDVIRYLNETPKEDVYAYRFTSPAQTQEAYDKLKEGLTC